ncbi:hypothetical protein [Bacillus cereus]|uniref:hypothetical protein n=1 Tax=Bacillus cereus TaxID=1396 RepID=UPI0018F702CA|nr:hypothetical protein [Bacillus cereus]MBJ8023707.1 hypothetical protein [Bacillus cereus]
MSETVKYKQMSIYDFISEEGNFLPEEKSQEVQPSETVPQVDEAQETVELYADGKLIATSTVPSSDLDTRASNTLDIETYETIVEECEEAFQPTEDTDSTLFSVGDKALVKNADDVYDLDHDDVEDYYGLKAHEGKTVIIESVTDNYYIEASGINFYASELQKI